MVEVQRGAFEVAQNHNDMSLRARLGSPSSPGTWSLLLSEEFRLKLELEDQVPSAPSQRCPRSYRTSASLHPSFLFPRVTWSLERPSLLLLHSLTPSFSGCGFSRALSLNNLTSHSLHCFGRSHRGLRLPLHSWYPSPPPKPPLPFFAYQILHTRLLLFTTSHAPIVA
jgi:hypothetical protein